MNTLETVLIVTHHDPTFPRQSYDKTIFKAGLSKRYVVLNFHKVVYDEHMVKGQTAKNFFWFLFHLGVIVALLRMLSSSKMLLHQACP
jgi:hypothetical protein